MLWIFMRFLVACWIIVVTVDARRLSDEYGAQVVRARYGHGPDAVRVSTFLIFQIIPVNLFPESFQTPICAGRRRAANKILLS